MNLWLPNERMLDWEFGVSRYKLLYTGWIDNKLYSTGNYIQYSANNLNGKII